LPLSTFFLLFLAGGKMMVLKEHFFHFGFFGGDLEIHATRKYKIGCRNFYPVGIGFSGQKNMVFRNRRLPETWEELRQQKIFQAPMKSIPNKNMVIVALRCLCIKFVAS
jgi:hypothetical protein